MFTADGSITTIGVYIFCVLGILISIALPIVRTMLPPAPGATLNALTLSDRWQQARPFVAIGIFSVLTALLIIAFTRGSLGDWRAALLAGYAWDSTLQKVAKS